MIAGAAWALDPPRAAPAAPSGEQQASPAPVAAPETLPETVPGTPSPAVPEASAPAAAVEDETLPPLPPEARTTGPTPQRFDPSEEVRADFPVSFPVDI